MMLGKTAGGLFWMFRYLERAENTARLIDAGRRIALTRSGAINNEWMSLLTTTGGAPAYQEKYGDCEGARVSDFLLRDKDNPGSVINSLGAARTNGRLVRTALSAEVWEATNDAWLAAKDALARPLSDKGLHDALQLIRHRCQVVRGAMQGTMLRNDIFSFARLGTGLERADNTARILDVKYYVLLPSTELVGTHVDNVQWEIILRALSAGRSYRWLNGGHVTARGICDFLILDPRMPRSLAFSYGLIDEALAEIADAYGEASESGEMASRALARLKHRKVDDVFDEGLHEFLVEMISTTGALALQIEHDYRFQP